jgi:hypothetical protein
MDDDTAARMLEKLLDRWERRTGAGADRRVTLSISGRDGSTYFATSGEQREQIHATLQNAEQTGAIELKWDRFEAAHELKSVVLKDAGALATFVGRSLASLSVADLDKKIEPLLADAAHPWIAEAYREARTRWLHGQPAFRLSLQDNGEDIVRLFAALKAVSNGAHVGMDMRTFSAKILKDSKAMERLQGSFARVWQAHHPMDPMAPIDLLATLGLEKIPQPILARGKLAAGTADLSAMRPFVGLPGESLASIRLIETPAYILTVENLASFQRHCREIEDDGFILFSSGFPNPSFQLLLQRLDAEIPSSVPFHHWGDTDVRGVEILAFIASLCPSRMLQPHLMDRSPWKSEVSATFQEMKVLVRIADGTTAASKLAERLVKEGVPCDFEQENVDPAPVPC